LDPLSSPPETRSGNPAAAPTVLEIRQLTKRYGKLTAVNGLNLEVKKGSIFGILGPNGSGKTTTLGMLLGVLKADEGYFKWFGQSPSKMQRRRIGAILETPNFYPYLNAEHNLKIIAEIKGAPKSRIDLVLDRVGLLERKRDRFKTYSLGMKQRLAIAAALLNEPEILVLDEPTNGLDPQGIADIRALIKSIAEEDVTILLASHLLDEVEKVCTDVAVLKRGNLLFAGKVDQIAGDKKSTLIELKASDMEALITAVESYPGFQAINRQPGMLELILEGNADSEALNRFLFEKGIAVSHLNLRRMSLEQNFLELTS
jgi:ABC-2 type transport system ATP-binding protein